MNIKQSELEVMVCDLFVDAYRAGQSCGDLAYNAARGTRASLIAKIAELYDEIADLKISNQEYDNVLTKKNDEIEKLYDEIERRKAEKAAIFNGTPCPGMKRRLSEIYGSKLTDPDEEVPDHHDAFDAMFPGCTPDDLPFPDVDDLTPASELLGGDE